MHLFLNQVIIWSHFDFLPKSCLFGVWLWPDKFGKPSVCWEFLTRSPMWTSFPARNSWNNGVCICSPAVATRWCSIQSDKIHIGRSWGWMNGTRIRVSCETKNQCWLFFKPWMTFRLGLGTKAKWSDSIVRYVHMDANIRCRCCWNIHIKQCLWGVFSYIPHSCVECICVCLPT